VYAIAISDDGEITVRFRAISVKALKEWNERTLFNSLNS